MFNIERLTIGDAHDEVVDLINTFGQPMMTEDNEWVKQMNEPVSLLITRPFMEPMVSKHSMYGKQFMDSYKEQLINTSSGGFAYTYGNRIRDYNGMDQLQKVIDMLNMNNNTRRAIIHTWMVHKDLGGEHVPCLQLVQLQLQNDKLNCVAVFRSNDMLMAWGANAYALVHLQKIVANGIHKDVGYLETISINAHIYHVRDASNLKEFIMG